MEILQTVVADASLRLDYGQLRVFSFCEIIYSHLGSLCNLSGIGFLDNDKRWLGGQFRKGVGNYTCW